MSLLAFNLRVPGENAFRGLAGELAARYLELAGVPAADARAFASSLGEAVRTLDPGHLEIELTVRREGRHLDFALQCGAKSTVMRHTLAALHS